MPAAAPIDGVPVPVRDLSSPELWDRSLARSRQRRRLTEIARRARRRRKSASLAVSAALVAAPILPEGVAAADTGAGGHVPGTLTDPGAARAASDHVVLRYGAEGALVAAAQHRLNQVLPLTHLAVDGIYGPLTRGAVADYQRRHGLAPTGAIDVRMWAELFDAPVLVVTHGTARPVAAMPTAPAGAREAVALQRARPVAAPTHSRLARTDERPVAAAAPGVPVSSPPVSTPKVASAPSSAGETVAVVAPTTGTPQTSTYVMVGGVALPLPRQYLVNGSVDQGVDYSAPGGTPLYAMGDGVIIGEGISGFGPNAPVLEITTGPLKGMTVYYGHAGSDLVSVGTHVQAGQQISEVGYGIVGISTGPHLEIGMYPPGNMGAGSKMLGVINGLLAQHPSGREWGATPSSSAARASSPVATSSSSSVSTASTASVRMSAMQPAAAAATRSGGASASAGSATTSTAAAPAPTASTSPSLVAAATASAGAPAVAANAASSVSAASQQATEQAATEQVAASQQAATEQAAASHQAAPAPAVPVAHAAGAPAPAPAPAATTPAPATTTRLRRRPPRLRRRPPRLRRRPPRLRP